MKTETKLFLSAVSLVEMAKMPVARARVPAKCQSSGDSSCLRADAKPIAALRRNTPQRRRPFPAAVSRHVVSRLSSLLHHVPAIESSSPLWYRHRFVISFSSLFLHPIVHRLSINPASSPPMFIHLPFIAAARGRQAATASPSRLSAANCTAVNESFCAEN